MAEVQTQTSDSQRPLLSPGAELPQTRGLFAGLTPGQRKFERDQAAGFLLVKKIQSRSVDQILCEQNAVGLQILIDLLAEYHVEGQHVNNI